MQCLPYPHSLVGLSTPLYPMTCKNGDTYQALPPLFLQEFKGHHAIIPRTQRRRGYICWAVYTTECLTHTVFLLQGCEQMAKALSVPRTSILCCLLLLIAGHSIVVVKGTDWIEPVIVWLTVVMPSGSGLYFVRYLGFSTRHESAKVYHQLPHHGHLMRRHLRKWGL